MPPELEEQEDGGVTIHVDPPAPAEASAEGANGTLAGQAIHDAARAEVIAERAEETAAEAHETSERIEEQCQTLSSDMETMQARLTELQTSLEQSQAENLALLQQIQSNTERNSGSPMNPENPENPTPEDIAAAAEILETPETNTSETETEPSSETKTEAHEENEGESLEHGEPITEVVRPRVLMY